MSPPSRTYRQLQPEDRVTLASLKQQHYSVRGIASVLGRSASTISRELRRNASAGHYGSATAQHSCLHRREQSRPLRKLHSDALLFGLVQHLKISSPWRCYLLVLASPGAMGETRHGYPLT